MSERTKIVALQIVLSIGAAAVLAHDEMSVALVVIYGGGTLANVIDWRKQRRERNHRYG